MAPTHAPTTGLRFHARRQLLVFGAGLGAWLLVRPAAAVADDLAAAIKAFAGGAEVRPGRVTIDIAALVDNGNAVPVTIAVDSAMTAGDHVVTIALFNERNPERDVIRCRLGPRSGRARLATRIRLATSQQLVAVAQMSDGSFWLHAVDVVVTLAACIEGEGLTGMARTLINVPPSIQRGEVIEIRTLIAHPMETGFRVGADGQRVSRDILRRFACRYNGELVFSAELFAAIAANPYVAFHFVAAESGTLSFTWEGDHGFAQTETVPISVT